MRNSVTATFACCALLACATVTEGAPPVPEDIAAWQARVDAARTRVDALRKSLPAVVQPWAGEYYEGDHLGFNLDLMVTADRFAYTVDSDVGPVGDGYGSVERTDDGIVLQLAPGAHNAGKRRLPDVLDTTLIPVHWGPRHYLVSEHEFPTFASAINHGVEPDSPGQFLLRVGDEKKPVKGLDGLPTGITRSIYAKPIYVDVVSFSRLPSPPQPSETARLLKNERYRLVFDKGAEDGLMLGLELWLCHPGNAAAFVTVNRIEAHRAYGILKVDFDLDPRPSTTWRFTTGQYPSTRACTCELPSASVTHTR